MTSLRPPGRDLAWDNRRLLADRLRWPLGALQECEWIDRDHPGWWAAWMDANAWAKRPAGYYARRWDGDHRDPWQYGVTPRQLAQAIETAPPPWNDIDFTRYSWLD